MREHYNYESGLQCSFRADGKLRGGVILEEKEGLALVGYYGRKYKEKWIDKTKIIVHIAF